MSERKVVSRFTGMETSEVAEAVGKVRVQTLRRAAALLTGLTVGALMLREFALLVALPGGPGYAAQLPIMILISIRYQTFAFLLAVFPLALPAIGFRSGRLGALAGLMLGPVACLGLAWLSRSDVGLVIPTLGEAVLMFTGSLATLFAVLEMRPAWRRSPESDGPPSSRWAPLLSAPPSSLGLVVALLVWVWACLPLPDPSEETRLTDSSAALEAR